MPLLDAFLPNPQATVTATAGAAPVAVALPPGAYLEIQNAGTGIVYFEMGPVGTVVDAATGTPILPGGARCFRRHVHTRSLVISLIAPAGGGAVYITGGVGAPGTRRRGYARAGAAAPVGPAPIFFAPLTTSLIPTTAGDPSFTFTRNTLAYVQDFEGILRSPAKKINEARFHGARRVENAANLPGNSTEGLVWVTSGTTPPAVGTTAFGGKTNASFVTFPAGAASSADSRANTYAAGFNSFALIGSQLRFSGYFALSRPLVGAETIVIVLDGGANYGTFAVWTAAAQPGATLTRYSTPAPTAPIAVNGAGFYMNPGATLTAPITVYSWGYQVESVGGQSNQAPAEYVSVGILAAPYNGAGVDGIKYFATTNGNSVDANGVVIEAAGAAIPAATMLGYVAENAATNVLLQSQAFDNAAWTKADLTVTPNVQVAPDGTLTADTLTDTAIANPHGISQTIGSGDAFTVYAKAGTLNWLQLFCGGGTAKRANFNLATGVVGIDTTTAAKITPLGNGWYRLAIPCVGNSNVQMFLSTADVGGPPTYAGGTGTIHVWGAQVETQMAGTPSVIPSSYIPTTTVAVTRNIDDLSYNMAGNLGAAIGSAYTEVTYPYEPKGLLRIVIRTTGPAAGAPQYHPSTGPWGMTLFNVATNIAQTANGPNVGMNKGGTAWSGTTASAALNGGVVATGGGFAAYPNAGLIGVGGTPATAAQTIQGVIRNVKFYNVRLTDAQLQTMTA